MSKRGKKCYKKAAYIPFEALINSLNRIEIFEGRIRQLITVERYEEIILYPINCNTYKHLMLEYVAYLHDNEIKSHIKCRETYPHIINEKCRVFTYSDYQNILANIKNY